ncbi:MAG: tetratricopeptide repeat protein, partial [Thermoguttaceae bacterium]
AALEATNNGDSASWVEIAYAEQKLGNSDKAVECIDKAVSLRADIWESDREKIYKLVGKVYKPTAVHGMNPPAPPKISNALFSELSGEPLKPEDDEHHAESATVETTSVETTPVASGDGQTKSEDLHEHDDFEHHDSPHHESNGVVIDDDVPLGGNGLNGKGSNAAGDGNGANGINEQNNGVNNNAVNGNTVEINGNGVNGNAVSENGTNGNAVSVNGVKNNGANNDTVSGKNPADISEQEAVQFEKNVGNGVEKNNKNKAVSAEASLEALKNLALENSERCDLEFRKRFLSESRLPKNRALWFFLHKPITTADDVNSSLGYSGGGHFLWNHGAGTIIDPGDEFLQNFIRFGGSLADVRNVVITNDNESNIAQVELIRSLLLRAGLAKNVRFFLNLGAIQKLSNILDLNDKSFAEGYMTLHTGAIYDLLGGGKIKAISAYHQELKSVDQSVGICFTLEDKNGVAPQNTTAENTSGVTSKKIVYTSNTGLFPISFFFDATDGKIVHVTDKNQVERIISDRYVNEGVADADLMVLSIGRMNIKFDKSGSVGVDTKPVLVKNEFDYINTTTTLSSTELAENAAVGHLGYLGAREVLTKCKPKLAVISDWSQDMMPIRVELTALLHVQTEQLVRNDAGNDAGSMKVLPSDCNLVYDIFANQILDCVKNDWSDALKITCAAETNELFYFNEDEFEQFAKSPKYFVNHFKNELEFKGIQ